MSLPLITALAVIAFAAGFHLYWALGGRRGFSVSLPQRVDGSTVMHHRIGWWRPAAGAVGLGLVVLGILVLSGAGQLALPLASGLTKTVLIFVGTAFVLRAFVPTPWTGFFKTIRTTRWARYDTWLYSPLFLLLGLSLLAIGLG
jgi:hypothetical protein